MAYSKKLIDHCKKPRNVGSIGSITPNSDKFCYKLPTFFPFVANNVLIPHFKSTPSEIPQ